MNTTSSQRWAIGAIALAILIACSPRPPQEPSQPEPNAPTVAGADGIASAASAPRQSGP